MDAAARGALLGMVFGDAYLNVRERKHSQNGRMMRTAEMRIAHSTKQRDYLEHKAGLVKKYLGGNFQTHEYANGPGGKYRCVAFSASDPYFKQLKEWAYPQGRKTFTPQVLGWLTPEGIALWYMDDGHARRNINSKGWTTSAATSIATMCSRAEIEAICAYFAEEHKISFHPRFDKRRAAGKEWFIEANTENSRLFAHLIQPYVIPSMLYKLAHVADMGAHECRAPVGRCQCGAPIYDSRRKGLCTACYSRRYYRTIRRVRDGRTPRAMI